MRRKRSGITYLLISTITILVIAISATIFSSYIDEQTRNTIQVSTYIGLDKSNSNESDISESTTISNNTSQNDIVVNSTANDILQLLSQSINSKESEQIESIYQQFTKEQLDNISLEEYQNYISLLKEIINGEVISYSTLSYTEAKELENSMLKNSNQYQEFLQNASYHKLEYIDKNGKDKYLSLVLSKDKDQKSFLSNKWVRGCLELNNFSRLYLSAIKDKNFEIVHKLTYSDTLDSDVKLQKTNMLVEFYKKHVDLNIIDNQKIVDLRLDEIKISLPVHGELDLYNTIGYKKLDEESKNTNQNEENSTNNRINIKDQFKYESGKQYNIHDISFIKSESGYRIRDYIPNLMWRLDAIVLKNESELIKINEIINFEKLYKHFSWPKEQYIARIDNTKNLNTNYYKLVFSDIDIYLKLQDRKLKEEDIKTDTNFKVVGFTLKTNKYSLANLYSVNNSLEYLYDIYIYVDSLDYSYVDDSNNIISFDMEGSQTIKSIKVKNQEAWKNIKYYQKIEDKVDIFKIEDDDVANQNN